MKETTAVATTHAPAPTIQGFGLGQAEKHTNFHRSELQP
jgi:hypothetical protein